MTQPTCPLCSHPVLCYIRPGELYWYCRHCYHQLPFAEQIDREKSLQNPISKDTIDRKHVDATLLQVRQELERLDRAKDDFLNTISHELRTLLTTMQLATQMLEITLAQEGVSSSKTAVPSIKLNQAAYFQMFRDACDQAICLIARLLSGFSDTHLRVFLMKPAPLT